MAASYLHEDNLSTTEDAKTAQAGDMALLVGRDHTSFIIQLEPNAQFNTHRGTVHHDDLIGTLWGTRVSTHIDYPILLLRPSTDDLVCNLKRTTQIVYPKDAGYILMKMNIHPGQRVVEAGTGSGGLTMVFAQAVSPTGRVFSYEVRPEIQQLARENLEQRGLAEFVTFKLHDIEEGFEENNADALFLDLSTPWSYLREAKAAMINGGFFGCILPTATQVIQMLSALKETGFGMIEVEEILLRPYKPIPERLRPRDRLTPHTGYLVFARSLIQQEE